MATGLAVVTLLGLFMNYLFSRIKLPGLLGMLILGIIIGPYGLNWIASDLMLASADFRKIALIIILLRAGLGISREALNKVGLSAIKLSFIPGVLEGLAVAFMATIILEFSWIQGGILGFILAAVSPAVIVPMMIQLSERGVGTDKNIPTLILAAASVDDVVAITIFSAFLGMYSGVHVNIGIQLAWIPVSILLGIGFGIVSGLVLVKLFERRHIRDTKKVLLILGIAIMLTAVETALKNRLEIAALLGVMTIGFILLEKRPVVAHRLSAKFGKIWVFAEILLFVLVGAQVNPAVAAEAGGKGLLIIAFGLSARSLGVLISTAGSKLTARERLFCVMAYWPKATVQAAIGAIPLTLGVKGGEVIMAVAVLSILITAPLGAVGIRFGAPRLLSQNEPPSEAIL
ncbi:cation:proton antiporter [Acidaminobacter hydrogenoformans]|uniref:Sodium/proton antiporter, CPA1 family (TC 2.A.36) n=1 Tax=Acidaminobacter hydrogenoformans DSM 2784 TaxID=1120920 RepID=A0A1G5RSY8_9FIRM|nr:cation:proton antiporter [Acidaminobacter hydrogenoformans]SCZ77126.1 sodium/proton antiporter, CPA1 family (TC 2.A.36) [Acidaminobacter hydrogenoformans DSM 2784]